MNEKGVKIIKNKQRSEKRKNKLQVTEILLDSNKNKICSVCSIDKPETEFMFLKIKAIFVLCVKIVVL